MKTLGEFQDRLKRVRLPARRPDEAHQTGHELLRLLRDMDPAVSLGSAKAIASFERKPRKHI